MKIKDLQVGSDYWIKFKWPYNPDPDKVQIRIGRWNGKVFVTAAGHSISPGVCIKISKKSGS